MAEKADMQEPHGLSAKLRDFGGAARDISHAALRETLSWSAYQWTVLALLTAIFLLIALSYGGIRAELAALKQNAGGAGDDRAAIEVELGRQVSDVKSGLDQALADMKSALQADLAAIGTKLDALRQAPKQAAPSQKPPAKPRPQ
jgi:hypothetical protein